MTQPAETNGFDALDHLRAVEQILGCGTIDVVLLNVGEPPSVLLNTNRTPFHRVLFKLVGTKSNRAAIGARVTIRAAGVQQFSEVRGGGSYLSQNYLRLHFGLGSNTEAARIEIRWPSGLMQKLEHVRGDRVVKIEESQETTGQR